MHYDCDVLVIGGGIAGAAAALAAAQEGARVLLASAGPAATALSIGAWWGAVPDGVRTALAHAQLILEPCTQPLPRPDGTLLHADFAPRSHARAQIGGDHTLICGIVGLPAFHASALSRMWADAAGVDADQLRPLTITLSDTPAAGWSPTSLAAQLERDPSLLAGPLAAAVRTHHAARVIVPAVLGLEAYTSVHERMEAHVGVAVGEALGGVPSLPGWRLDVALRNALLHAGVEVLRARVIGQQTAGELLEAVTCMSDDGTRTIRAPSVVLATGKFLGGGLSADPQLRESVLGSKIIVSRFDRHFDSATESLLLTSEQRTAAQPLLEAGVRVDAESRPVTVSGDVAYRNVHIAGSLRADVETARYGLGDAASDGWNAGLRAGAHARVTA